MDKPSFERAMRLIAATQNITRTCANDEEIAIVMSTMFNAMSKESNIRKILHDAKVIQSEFDIFKKAKEKPQPEEDRTLVEAIYDKETNVVTFDIAEKEVDKRYMQYLTEAMGLPSDVKIEYTK